MCSISFVVVCYVVNHVQICAINHQSVSRVGISGYSRIDDLVLNYRIHHYSDICDGGEKEVPI